MHQNKSIHAGSDPFRMSRVMMAGSLTLLGLFLAFWLKTVYDDEASILKNDSNQLFINTIRDIENRHLNELLGGDFFVRIEDSAMVVRQTTQLTLEKKQINEVKKLDLPDEVTEVRLDTSRTINVQLSPKPALKRDPNKMFGSLSMFVVKVDSTGASPHSDTLTRIIPVLDSVFSKMMLEKHLPVDFDVIIVKNSYDSTRTLLTNTYMDVPTGAEYAVALKHYRTYLLKRILPESFFSLFLFSVIALAFFLIYQNLKKQHQLTLMKNDLISNITHELKTPITTVGVAIEALRNFDALQSPDRTQEYLDISRQELNRLSLLVDRVLKMSLYERGATDLNFETIHFEKLVAEVLAAMKLLFERSDATVDFKSDGREFIIKGDPAHLSSVIYNLLDNALKYARPGVAPAIQVSLQAEAKNLLFEVADNGIGIPPAYLDKIFDKFFRVPQGDTHHVKGYGLGLSYVANVIKQHRGKIEVKSETARGTIFTISLPLNETEI